MIKKIISLFLLATLISGCSSAGEEDGGIAFQRSVVGRVRAPNGKGIAEATVFITDTNIEVVTDREGEFSFRARLSGPALVMRIKERGSSEVSFPISIREDRPSKLGLNILKAGGEVTVLQSIDTALIPSEGCGNIFRENIDLTQIGATDDRCQVATSAILTGTQVGGITINSTVERCPREIDCPINVNSTFEFGLVLDLPAGLDRDYCDYTIRYRNSSNELLQTLRINSNGSRLTSCN
jgi:hypothetical protein